MINKGYNYPPLGRYEEYRLPNNWIERKKEQLWERLNNVAYIVAFIKLHWQGYRIINNSHWSYMLKWLSNPEYYCIQKYPNSGNTNFVRSSEYARYECKSAGRSFPC